MDDGVVVPRPSLHWLKNGWNCLESKKEEKISTEVGP
jgi:hypothetical protein